MRVFTSCLVAALCAACGPSDVAGPTESAATTARAATVNPVNIERVRGDLPEGYEIADLVGRGAPLESWGFGGDWVSDPPQCGSLADPAGDDATVRGWSASGAGGIVYAVVADAGVSLDQAIVEECGSWTVSAGRTSGTVTLVGAPTVDGAPTLGMTSDVTTRVEGGTETHSRAYTFTAYLGDYVTQVTVVTDPGAAGPSLDAEFAAALLTKAVSALRG